MSRPFRQAHQEKQLSPAYSAILGVFIMLCVAAIVVVLFSTQPIDSSTAMRYAVSLT